MTALRTATAYLQLKCVYLLILTEVPFAFVLHHLAVRLAGHQPMHVVIWKPTEERKKKVICPYLCFVRNIQAELTKSNESESNQTSTKAPRKRIQ